MQATEKPLPKHSLSGHLAATQNTQLSKSGKAFLEYVHSILEALF